MKLQIESLQIQKELQILSQLNQII